MRKAFDSVPHRKLIENDNHSLSTGCMPICAQVDNKLTHRQTPEQVVANWGDQMNLKPSQ